MKKESELSAAKLLKLFKAEKDKEKKLKLGKLYQEKAASERNEAFDKIDELRRKR